MRVNEVANTKRIASRIRLLSDQGGGRGDGEQAVNVAFKPGEIQPEMLHSAMELNSDGSHSLHFDASRDGTGADALSRTNHNIWPGGLALISEKVPIGPYNIGNS
jgi:hypothetical protein